VFLYYFQSSTEPGLTAGVVSGCIVVSGLSSGVIVSSSLVAGVVDLFSSSVGVGGCLANLVLIAFVMASKVNFPILPSAPSLLGPDVPSLALYFVINKFCNFFTVSS
jgi:hypothetical protein